MRAAGFSGWLKLFLDEADVLPDHTKVCHKEIGHERFTLFVDAVGVEGEGRSECLVCEHG